MERNYIIHGPPDTYLNEPNVAPHFSLYRTENGYMDRKTFALIINDFISTVKHIRKRLVAADPDINQRVVLILDGHKSRYDPGVFRALREADIDLVVLVAHSSHICQPLDLRIFSILKRTFLSLWYAGPDMSWSESIIKPPDPSEPPTKKKPVKQETSEDDEECSGPLEVSFAEFDRVKFLDTLYVATRKIPPDTLRGSWRQSNLHPYVPVPPSSPESEEDLQRQIACNSSLGRRRSVSKTTVPLTGLINSPEDTRLLDLLEKKKVEVVPSPQKKSKLLVN